MEKKEHNFPWPRLSTDHWDGDSEYDIECGLHFGLHDGSSFTKEELTLPPMLPESEFGPTAAKEREAVEKQRPDLARYDLSRLTNEAKRLHDLPKRTWSAAVEADKKGVSRKERSRLEHAFTEEINAVLIPLIDFARVCVHCSYETRRKFVDAYKKWAGGLWSLTSKGLMCDTDTFRPYYLDFVQLEFDMIALYIRARSMAMIEAAYNNSGVFVSDFINVTVERERENKVAEEPTEPGQGTEPGRESSEEAAMPPNYIPCIEIAGIIRKRSDAIARTLRVAKYPVKKKAGKNYCDPEHAAILFPKWKKHLKRQQEDK